MNHLRKLTPADFRYQPFVYPPDEPLRLGVLPCTLAARRDYITHRSLPRQLPADLRPSYTRAWQQEATDRNDALLAYQNEEAQNAYRSR